MQLKGKGRKTTWLDISGKNWKVMEKRKGHEQEIRNGKDMNWMEKKEIMKGHGKDWKEHEKNI